MESNYNFFGVSSTADDVQLRNAYLIKMKQHHPDLNPHDSEDATAKTQLIVEAYEAICKSREKEVLTNDSQDEQRFFFGSVLDVSSSLKRKGEFAQALREFEKHPKDVVIALKLIHWACRAQVLEWACHEKTDTEVV